MQQHKSTIIFSEIEVFTKESDIQLRTIFVFIYDMEWSTFSLRISL